MIVTFFLYIYINIYSFTKKKKYYRLLIGANLAYVKHFGGKTDAVSATFKSCNSKGFMVTYKTSDGTEHETFIEYTSPVKTRQDLRPVLEAMAKEAEEALGMVIENVYKYFEIDSLIQ